jgi:hypothetical protein
VAQTPSTGSKRDPIARLGLRVTDAPKPPPSLLAPIVRNPGTGRRTSFVRDSFCYPDFKDERSNCTALGCSTRGWSELRGSCRGRSLDADWRALRVGCGPPPRSRSSTPDTPDPWGAECAETRGSERAFRALHDQRSCHEFQNAYHQSKLTDRRPTVDRSGSTRLRLRPGTLFTPPCPAVERAPCGAPAEKDLATLEATALPS